MGFGSMLSPISLGMKEGIEQGSKCKQIEVAKNLLSIHLPLEQISDATGLSIDEIKKLQSN